MKFAINAPNYGTFADPRLLAELAGEAEAAGWDGFFLWDHILPGTAPAGDPWVQLAAMAMTTQTLRLGPMVTPLPRRRPWKLAREAVTLDRLSGGRLVLGLGLGDDSLREYSAFGEPVESRLHGEMLDEGLSVLEGLWSGEPFSFKGTHYAVDRAQFLPQPVQTPRIPIWLAGRWPAPKPFRRAAGWDGVAPVSRSGMLSPEECREVAAFVREQREDSAGPFDIVVAAWPGSRTLEHERELVAEYESAGATWYQVVLSPTAEVSRVREVIERGPPRA